MLRLRASPFGMNFCALFLTLLLELTLGGNGAPGDGRTCNPLTPVHVLERSHFFDKYTKMSGNRPKREPFWTTLWPGNRSEMLKIGAWDIWGAKLRGRERFGMQNGGERSDLGCKMEGKMIDLGARWRNRRLRIGYAAPGEACR